MTAELTEDSLRLSLPDRSSDWRWAAVQRVVDHRDAWLLRLSTHQALILPKEAFTDQQRAEFLAFAERKGFGCGSSGVSPSVRPGVRSCAGRAGGRGVRVLCGCGRSSTAGSRRC
ncbi:YcxB family protein [Streptomyces sp. NBC_00201]|uniref:YcxB family protein n=1 Tax=Streptomyces sp. NBC_00201 TaxID=2975679 RepID=UPI00338E683F